MVACRSFSAQNYLLKQNFIVVVYGIVPTSIEIQNSLLLNMISNHRQQFLKLIMRESVDKSFGKYILSSITSINTTNMPNDVGFHLIVPHSLCRNRHTNPKSEKGDSLMATSTLMAVFDELSTNGLMMRDKHYRGGVSVHLTTEVLQPIPAEKEVIVTSSAEKIGKVIGFCSMELWNADRSKLLARGKHIKFMPHGTLWDFVAQPFIFPAVLYYYHNFVGTKFKTIFDNRLFSDRDHKFIRHKEGDIPPFTLTPEQNENGLLFKDLGITQLPVTEDLQKLVNFKDRDVTSFYYFKVRRHLCNRLGALHGGAVGTIAEEACGLSRKEICDKLNISMAVEKIESRYLNPMGVSITICLSVQAT